MQFHQLYPNFLSLSPLEKEVFIRKYREERAFDLERSLKRKRASISLTEEEKTILKTLGIKKKDLLTLKEIL
jgi:hypothetical protein